MSEALSLPLFLDVVIVVLLAATIAYAAILNRKLARLRSDRGEMEAVIARLIEATDAAQKGLEGLRAHAEDVGQGLQTESARAQGRADELAFLIERAEAVSGRLERAASEVPARPAKTAAPAKPPAPESKLLKSLQGVR